MAHNLTDDQRRVLTALEELGNGVTAGEIAGRAGMRPGVALAVLFGLGIFVEELDAEGQAPCRRWRLRSQAVETERAPAAELALAGG